MRPAAGAGPSGATDGYEWTRASMPRPVTPLPQVSAPPAHGLDAGLDHIVKLALDRTGLMDKLAEVTGKLDELTDAALEWQAQAKAVQGVARSLRSGAETLSGEWEGQASASFGAHLGKVVAAMDSTAADMDRTASILSLAASECKTAEETVVELIREAIETLVETLAGMVVIDIVTLGLATVADALVAEAEIAVFIARVARVCEKLSWKLEELMSAVRQIRTFGGELHDGLRAAKAVRQVGGMVSTGKAVGSLVTSPSMAHAGEVLATQGVKHYNEIVKVAASPLGKGDVVGPLKDGLTAEAEADAEAVKQQFQGGTPEAPYRVPKSGTSEVAEAFG
jgi:uncharacterized protein YukE